MRFILYIIFLSAGNLSMQAQDQIPGYDLEVGDRFFIRQDLNQTTESDNMEITGNASLDIRFRLDMHVTGILPGGSYDITCSYSELALDFFSPSSGHAISSRSDVFTPIQRFLELLEEFDFGIRMSDHGKILRIWNLDRQIRDVTFDGTIDSTKSQVIRQTLTESFGSGAVYSLSSILTDVYNDSSDTRCEKENTIFFNAKPVEIQKTLYYSEAGSENLRVQGIGMITESTGEIKFSEGTIVSTMKGSQTFDYLVDRKTGWIIRGVSKQKIHTLSVIKGNSSLPEGIRIPSITSSEYVFSGGVLQKD